MLVDIAKIGRTVGVNGYLKLNILTDFPTQLQVGQTYITKKENLTIEKINSKKEVKFKDYNSKEEAKELTNLILQLPKEEGEKLCDLKEDEFFWYDIIGLDVYEDNDFLGTIKDIQRFPSQDHLVINLHNQKIKRILFPFSQRTIKNVNLDLKRIEVYGAKEMISVLEE